MRDFPTLMYFVCHVEILVISAQDFSTLIFPTSYSGGDTVNTAVTSFRGVRDGGVLSMPTGEMIHHHGVSLSKQQTADLLLCHGTQCEAKLDDAQVDKSSPEIAKYHICQPFLQPGL